MESSEFSQPEYGFLRQSYLRRSRYSAAESNLVELVILFSFMGSMQIK